MSKRHLLRITVSPELRARLTAAARRQGLSRTVFIAQLLARLLAAHRAA